MRALPYCLLTTILWGCSPAMGPSHPTESESGVAAGTQFERFADVEGLEKSVAEVEEDLAGASESAKAQVIDGALPAATRLYVEKSGVMSPSERAQLMSLLIRFNDKRALPAFELCLAQLLGEKGKKPEDLFVLLHAYERGHLSFLAPVLLDIYPKYQARTQMGGVTYRAFAKALTEGPHKDWESTALELLERPIRHPATFKTRDEKRAAIGPYRDELFWQITAAQILGNLRSKRAVRPLLQVVLDPSKGDMATTALLALTKIGGPTVDAAEAAILGQDSELARFAAEAQAHSGERAAKIHSFVSTIAAVLGASGVARSEDVLLRALPTAKTNRDRALILRELSRSPSSEGAKKAFRSGFETLDCAESLTGTSVCTMVAESAVSFMDSALVPWLLREAKRLRKNKASAQALVMSALKVATVQQLPELQKAAASHGLTDLLEPVEEVLTECREEAACYLGVLQEPKNQEKAYQLRGIKAAYMLGALGSAEDAWEMSLARPKITNAAVHYVALQAVDALLPKGDELIAEILRVQIGQDGASQEPVRMRRNAPAKQVLYRLEARWIDQGGVSPVLRPRPLKVILPPEIIRLTTRKNFGAFRACYEQGLSRDPILEGVVMVDFVITLDGSVSQVEDGGSNIPDQEVTQCVLEAFRKLRFPQPEGGIVKVTYPIQFSPG